MKKKNLERGNRIMSDEFRDFDKTPALTFGEPEAGAAAAGTAGESASEASSQAPEASKAVPAETAPAAKISAPIASAAAAAAKTVEDMTGKEASAVKEGDTGLSENSLTLEERKQVDEFSGKIDVRNTQAILSYGAGAQKKMADFSEKALENVRTKDLGDTGNMIANLVVELKSFDVTEEEKKGIFGFFKKQTDKMTLMKTRYDKAETNVDQICKGLEEHQATLIKDIATLDRMYDLNLTYYKELTMYILAGKKKLAEIRNGELRELTEKARKSGLAEDAQAAKDLDSLCDRFEKKLYDLQLTRQVSLQTAPQIRLIQDSDEIMVEKIQSTLVNTIPLWKNQMVIAMGIEHSNQAAQAQQAVTDVTNQLLKNNAAKLKTASIETARASERGIVDMETLKQTNSELISTLDEVLKIQEDGHAKRMEAENEMARMESELKDKLIEMSRNEKTV